MLLENMAGRLAERRQAQAWRRHRVVDGPQDVTINIDGKEFLSFCSNDYLGLANHPRVKQAFFRGVEQYGVGSGAAHLITGHTRAHQELEEALAEFTGRDRALIFSTGYMANLGVLSALTERRDLILEDKLNHASLIDGAQLSRAELRRYAHNDLADLRDLMAKNGERNILLATDGVFSMEGDTAPLDQLAQVCADSNATLMVDDAHGFGVLGESGAGSVEMSGLDQQQVPILMATLGKAAGVFGAFVAGSETLIESLIQFARSYVYTTAPPAAMAVALLESLRIMREEPERRRRLLENADYLNRCLWELGLASHSQQTPIQPVRMPDNETALSAQQALEDEGLLVTAIRPPTVPAPILRITLCSEHSREQIDRLLSVLDKVKGKNVQ